MTYAVKNESKDSSPKAPYQTSGKLLVIPKGGYRRTAQTNWGLTDEQMKGMHVHHRIPVSKGGTNDPANLYVCSPSFHAFCWHNRSFFIVHASARGKTSAKQKPKSHYSKMGKVGGPKAQQTHRKNGTGCYSKEHQAKGGRATGKNVVVTNLETTKEYQFTSTRQASIQLGVPSQWLYRVLRGEIDHFQNYTIRYS